MILWFHRTEDDSVKVYRTPNDTPPERDSRGNISNEYKRNSICWRGFLNATGIRLRKGQFIKMDWTPRSTPVAIRDLPMPKKRHVFEAPLVVLRAIYEAVDELVGFHGPPAPAVLRGGAVEAEGTWDVTYYGNYSGGSNSTITPISNSTATTGWITNAGTEEATIQFRWLDSRGEAVQVEDVASSDQGGSGRTDDRSGSDEEQHGGPAEGSGRDRLRAVAEAAAPANRESELDAGADVGEEPAAGSSSGHRGDVGEHSAA